MSRGYWLVKQEPSAYSWDTFVREGGTAWTGVRNFQARNHLRAMKRGDLVAFYHSVTDRAIVGIARVTKTAYADPTAEQGDWSCVDLKPVCKVGTPLTLGRIKSDSTLRNLLLVRQSRLSVSPVTQAEFERILTLSETRLP